MTEVLGRKGLFRLIQQPLRSTRTGSGILLLCVVLLSTVSFSERITAWAVLVSLLLVVTSILTREIQALHLSCFSAFFVALPYLLPSLRTWPYLLLIPRTSVMRGGCCISFSRYSFLSSFFMILPVAVLGRSILAGMPTEIETEGGCDGLF